MLAFSVCFLPLRQALAAGVPRQEHVYITTNELFRLPQNQFDEMPFKLDSTENPRSSKKYQNPLENK